ncbi:MAG TPA: hypothetical protein DCS24_02495 [Erythrobacter sp.]|nr:hypothetical protein [Erythrobacter sp.]
MTKLIYCIHRKADLSREEFQRYWRETYAPLVKAAQEALGIRLRWQADDTCQDPRIAALL